MILRRLALIVAWYVASLFLLYVTDVGEKRRYRDRAGLKRLLLHGLLLLPITALVAMYTSSYIGPTP
jgi:hypothetical protein